MASSATASRGINTNSSTTRINDSQRYPCWRQPISVTMNNPKPNWVVVATSTSQHTNNKSKNNNKSKRLRGSNKKKSPALAVENDVVSNSTSVENDKKQQEQQKLLDLEDVNPVGLGRRSRQLFDEVWRKFSGLGQISSTTRPDQREALDALLIREGPMCEFAIPGAQNTTVLVVGATSSIGRIVVRKLMLRGYSVKVKQPTYLLQKKIYIYFFLHV